MLQDKIWTSEYSKIKVVLTNYNNSLINSNKCKINKEYKVKVLELVVLDKEVKFLMVRISRCKETQIMVILARAKVIQEV